MNELLTDVQITTSSELGILIEQTNKIVELQNKIITNQDLYIENLQKTNQILQYQANVMFLSFIIFGAIFVTYLIYSALKKFI